MHPVLTALMLLQAPAPPALPAYQAKDLPPAPGPVAQYPDPAQGPGASAFDLQIRRGARQGPSIPAVAVPKGSLILEDVLRDPSGRKAYRIQAPPKATIHVRLKGPHAAWFVVMAMNKWGKLEPGMLQNIIPTGNPEASFKNPADAEKEVYFVVDTTEVDARGETFTLTVTVS